MRFNWALLLWMFLLCVMVMGTLRASVEIIQQRDKTVWMHRDNNWDTCSCSVDNPESYYVCENFLKMCEAWGGAGE